MQLPIFHLSLAAQPEILTKNFTNFGIEEQYPAIIPI
jgi:hypothetical protein